MFSVLLNLWRYMVTMKPGFMSRTPHFNFITAHYFWIVGMALFGSLCMFINGGLRYIDALFFACGAATQSGLNTVDVNLLNSWQQTILFVVPMVTNPITINTFVVFLRLYWFEKRFQKIAKESKKQRKSRSKSFDKSFNKSKMNERDIGKEEMGVNGRNIVVMHGASKPNGTANGRTASGDITGPLRKEESPIEKELDASITSGNMDQVPDAYSRTTRRMTNDEPHHAQIKFANQVKRSNGLADEELHLPTHRNTEEHIAFLNRQRNPDDRSALRIPGPRDADAGVAPQTVDGTDNLDRTTSRRTSAHEAQHELENVETLDASDQGGTNAKRNITIEEPLRSPISERIEDNAQAAVQVLGVFRARKPRIFNKDERLHGEETHIRKSRTRAGTFSSLKTALSSHKDEVTPYLSWEPTVGRNSQFVNMTEDQREELGGIEYRSLKSLALILVLYFVGFSIFGFISLVPWILKSGTYAPVIEKSGIGRVWWGFFTSNSAFMDLGFTLTPDSMISFNTAIWPLSVMSFLIVIGNTGFPIMLRIIVWVTAQYVPKNSGIWEELRFLLDHPRRCFTLLFPSKATWWLFWILVILNGVDLIFFIILDLGNTVVTQLPLNIRMLNGWFQAVSTRTAGLAVVNLADLHPAVQVSYLIMMYISVLPIAISVRRTNVYEEKSLGIYGSSADETHDENETSYVGAHLRRQLSFDLWYIFLGVFIIALSEGGRIQGDDIAFNMFSILFEIVSAYGTVGLSLGYTGINASFSAEFGVIAKLVIIAMQIRGRHRGLPYELDRAILLPSEHVQRKEAEDAAAWVQRRNSMSTMNGNGAPPNGLGITGSYASKVDSHASRGSKRQGKPKQNFIASLLHPGPMTPGTHWESMGGDHISARRGSNAADEMNGERSRSPVSENGVERYQKGHKQMQMKNRSKTG